MNDRARIMLITAVTAIATCGGGLWYFRHDFDYVHNGPHKVEAADLLKLTSLSELPTPWVRFTPDEVVATEGVLCSGHAPDVVLGRIYLVRIQDHWMIALLNTSLGQAIEGKLLVGRPYYTKEITEIAHATQAIHNGKLLPFEIHGYDDDTSDSAFGYYFMLFLGGVGAVCLVMAVYWQCYPPPVTMYYDQSYDQQYELEEAYSYSGPR